MTPAQITLLLEHILDKKLTMLKFSWEHTDSVLHVHFLDAGGNKFHKSFNKFGHVLFWDD
jgi:hypothetical protein